MTLSITLTLPLERVVGIDRNLSGAVLQGECLGCGARGWLQSPRFGYPHTSPAKDVHALRHRQKCPLNEVLDGFGVVQEKTSAT